MSDKISDGQVYMAWKGVDGDSRIWWSQRHAADGTWAGPQPLNGPLSGSGVALAGPAGGNLYLAWKGVEGDQRIFWGLFPRSGGAFADRGPVPGAATSVGPALTTAYGQIIMAWKGVEGDQRIWWSRLADDHWTPPRPIPGASTSFGPALATNHLGTYGVPVMAWKGVDGDPRVWWSVYEGGTSDGDRWTGPFSIDNFHTSGGVALAGPPHSAPYPRGGLFMAWKGATTDQRIFWASMSGDGVGWTDHGPISGASTNVGPALAFDRDTLQMTWKGVEGDARIFASRLAPGKTDWGGIDPVPGAGTSFRPSVATVGN